MQRRTNLAECVDAISDRNGDRGDHAMLAMPHVAALAALLRDGGVRASSAGAAETVDAVLTTCNGLQAAALDPAVNSHARKVALRAARLLSDALAAPGGAAPPAALADPAPVAERRAGAAVVSNDAAHPATLEDAERCMLQRTAAALMSPQLAFEGDTVLERLMIAAAGAPALDALTGRPSGLATAAQEALAVELQRPLSELRLSQRGWAACFTLRPPALHAVLAAVLHDLTSAAPASAQVETPLGAVQPPAGQLRLLQAHAAWTTALRAVAAHPALHLAARSLLSAWVCQSGSMAAWKLQAWLVQTALAAEGLSRPDVEAFSLPAGVAALYPRALHAAATAVHSVRSGGSASPAGLQLLMAESEAALANGSLDTQEVWLLLLDSAPAWAGAALHALPLDSQISARPAAPAPCMDDGVAAKGSDNDVAASSTAARYVSWLMWPHSALRRRALQQTLLSAAVPADGDDAQRFDPGEVGDAAAVRPWVDTLRRWREEWGDGV